MLESQGNCSACTISSFQSQNTDITGMKDALAVAKMRASKLSGGYRFLSLTEIKQRWQLVISTWAQPAQDMFYFQVELVTEYKCKASVPLRALLTHLALTSTSNRLTVTVTEALVLRPILEDLGCITESIQTYAYVDQERITIQQPNTNTVLISPHETVIAHKHAAVYSIEVACD